MSTDVNLSSSTWHSSVREPPPASSSCDTYSWNVVSKQSYSHKLNQCDEDSVSAFHRVVTSKELYDSETADCAQACNMNHDSRCADAPDLLCSSADSVVCQSVAATDEVGDSGPQCPESAVSCGRINQSVTRHCTRKTCNNDEWTAASYKLERLDMSGCWKISDLSVRYMLVYCC